MKAPTTSSAAAQTRRALQLGIDILLELESTRDELAKAVEERQALEAQVEAVCSLLCLDWYDGLDLAQVVREAIATARKDASVPIAAGERGALAKVSALAGERWGRLVRISDELTAIAGGFGVEEPHLRTKLERLAHEAVKETTTS